MIGLRHEKPADDSISNIHSREPNDLRHHVVEQAQEARFGASLIHNTNNVIRVEKRINEKLNGFYSSKQTFTQGMTVRDWLKKNLSFEEQYEFGIKQIQLLGAL